MTCPEELGDFVAAERAAGPHFGQAAAGLRAVQGLRHCFYILNLMLMRFVVMLMILLCSVIAAEPATSTQPAAPNDPLALPKGFTPAELELMKPGYPKPQFVSDIISGEVLKQPNFEKWDPEVARKRLSFLVPKGATDVARGKKVTGSDPAPEGDYAQFTDGIAAGNGTAAVQLDPGTQWVQVDLGERCHLWKVLLWHHYLPAVVCHDVIVQVSDDRFFNRGVTTLFNNDHDNSSGLGTGVDPAYAEMHFGRLIDGCASEATGRYVRFYGRGNTNDQWNQFVEVSIYGTPVSTPSK
jgi:hypothetical protein